MAEVFPVSRGEYDPSFAFDTSDVAPLDISAYAPPPIKRHSPYPIGYNDATKQMFVNGETFDFDDHQSALDTREALKRPKQKMPSSFRPIEPDTYIDYINRIRDPSLGRLASKNFGIGVDNLQLLAGYGLQLAGMEDLGKGIADQQLKDLRKNQPYQRAFTDISVDKPGGIIDWFVANLAQQGPMLLESIAAAGVGAVVGGATGGPVAAIGGLIAGLGGKAGFKSAALAAAKKRATGAALSKAEKTLLGRVGGAALATAASNYALGASDVYGEQLEGGTEDKGKALALAVPYALAETIPELIGAGLLFKGAKGGMLKRFGKGFGLGVVGEGTTEAVQEMITASQNPNLSDEEKSLRYINAFAAGAGVGGTVTGLGLAARGRPRDTTAAPTEEVADPLAAEQEGAQERLDEQIDLFDETQAPLQPYTDLETETIDRAYTEAENLRERDSLLAERDRLSRELDQPQGNIPPDQINSAIEQIDATLSDPRFADLPPRGRPLDPTQPEDLLGRIGVVPPQNEQEFTTASSVAPPQTLEEQFDLWIEEAALEDNTVTTADPSPLLDEDSVVAEPDFDVAEQDFGVVEQDFDVAEQDFGVVEQDFDVAEQDFGVAEQDFGVAEQDFGVAEDIAETAAPTPATPAERLRAQAPSKTDNIKQSKTKFAPTTEPQLINRRDKKDLPATAKGEGQISGGKQEGIINDPEKKGQIFDRIEYTQSLQLNLVPGTVETVYAGALDNIKVTNRTTNYSGAHHNGGVVLQSQWPYARPIAPNIIAHELGHASHSLLGEQLNNNPAVLNELQAIERTLYPDLRVTVTNAIDGGKKLRSSDIEFFNYLLSPEELIAEFNVLRLAHPEQAAQIAPVLSQLLESVEQAPNLVVDRDTFPSGFGTIVVPAKDYFDGDYTKLNGYMAAAQRGAQHRADIQQRREDAQKRKAGADRPTKTTGRKKQTGASPQGQRTTKAAKDLKTKGTKKSKDRSTKSGAEKLAGKQPSKRAKSTGTGAATLKRRGSGKTKDDDKDSAEGQPAGQPITPPIEREVEQPDSVATDTPTGLTPEAAEFLVAASQGMPGSITNNLRRIARENGINITSRMTPQDVVNAFQEKSDAFQKAKDLEAQSDSVVIDPNYSTPALAWDNLRNLAHAGYRRTWNQLESAKRKTQPEIVKAHTSWLAAHKKYLKTGIEGDLIVALAEINDDLPLTFIEEHALILESLNDAITDTQRQAEFLKLFRFMFNSTIRSELQRTDAGKEVIEKYGSVSNLIQDATEDKIAFSQAFKLFIDEYVAEYKQNSITIRSAELANFIEQDEAVIGAVDILVQSVHSHGKKLGKMPNEELTDAVAQYRVIEQVDVDNATVEVTDLIAEIEEDLRKSPTKSTSLDPTSPIGAKILRLQNLIQHSSPDMKFKYRDVPLKEWVSVKGVLKTKPTRKGGSLFVIDTPKNATPSIDELLTDADAKPIEGRSSTWEGKPIIKPISMGVLRMERVKIMRTLNPKARPSVKIYTNVETLKAKDPAIFKEAMDSRSDKKPIPTNAAGYAYSTTDASGRIRYKVLLFQENINDRRHARFVVAHEAIGHLGLRTIMSDQKFNSIMTQLYKEDPAIREKADYRMATAGMKKLEAIEEAVADAAGTIESKLLNRLTAAIRSFINKLLGRRIFTDDWTRYFIHQSKYYLRTGTVSDPSYAGIYNNMQELQRRHVEGRASAETETSLNSIVMEQHGINTIHTNGVWDYIKRTARSSKGISRLLGWGLQLIQTLDNIALQSPGLKAMLGIFNLQHEYIRDLQTKYRDIAKFSTLTRTVFNPEGLDKTERDQVNELLWKATLYKAQQLEVIGADQKPLYEQDITVKRADGTDEVVQLVDVLEDGTVKVNTSALKQLVAKGSISKKEFKDGFIFKTFDNAGKEIKTTGKRELAVKFEITDRVWKAYQEQRRLVEASAMDVYIAKIWGMSEARQRHYEKIEKNFNLGDQMHIVKGIGDLYSGLSSRAGKNKKAYSAIYQLLRVMHEEHGTFKMDDFFGDQKNLSEEDAAAIKDIRESDDGVALINQLNKLTEKKLSENNLKRLTRALMDTVLLDAQVTDAELRAKQTIMGAYAPLKRRGRLQVRVVAYDESGNPIRLDDRLRSMLTYIKTDNEADAFAIKKQLNTILTKIKPGTRMLSDDITTREGRNIDEDGLVAISKLEAIVEESSVIPPLGGTINYDDLAGTLLRAGVNLSARDRASIVKLTASHHSLARQNLMRQGSPGFDTDMMRAIAEHVETGSHIAGKNRYQHAIAEILADDNQWFGDPNHLKKVQDEYRSAVSSGNQARIFDARKALDEYQRMVIQSSGRTFNFIVPKNGNLLNTETITGKGKGNRYRGQATNLVKYYRETRNLMDATGEGVIGKTFRPVIGATAAAQLGFLMAPAIVNMTSLYTHAIPYLSTYNSKTGYGAGHGMGAATAAIHRAMSSVSLIRDGFTKDVFGTAASMDELIKQAEKDISMLDKYDVSLDELKFLRDLTAKGVLTPNLNNALLDIARTGRRSILGKGMESWMALFSKTEQYNRRVTALASYRLETERLKAQGKNVFLKENKEDLYSRATLAVNTSQGNYSQYNRPAWARGNILQFTYMYKQFIVISVQLMRNLAPKERRIFLATLFLAAGLKGMPFGDDILDLIDTLAQMFGIRWDGAEAEAAQLADSIIPGSSVILLRGILDAATGLTLSSRVGHGDLIPGTGMFKAGANVGKELESILGAPASFISAVATSTALSAKYLAEVVGLRDDVTSLADIGREGFGIAAIKAITDGIVYATSGEIINKRGQIVAKDATLLHSIARMTGFYPRKATLEYDVTRMTQQVSDYSKELSAAFRHAYVKGNASERREILKQVRRIQRRYKGTPFDLRNFSTSARKAAKEADRTASQRSLRAAPTSAKQLAKDLATAYGL